MEWMQHERKINKCVCLYLSLCLCVLCLCVSVSVYMCLCVSVSVSETVCVRRRVHYHVRPPAYICSYCRLSIYILYLPEEVHTLTAIIKCSFANKLRFHYEDFKIAQD